MINQSQNQTIAIVDYGGTGNLFSVKHACENVGLTAIITSKRETILSADAVILPGVGAFGDAMRSLTRLDLIHPLKELAASATPLIGICLGFQLLMEESSEFGIHQGLGIVTGSVLPFEKSNSRFKVPHVGWNRIHKTEGAENRWSVSPLSGVRSDEYLYFVHSYYVAPTDTSFVSTTSRYADTEFCSSIQFGNVFACQFHPERSGIRGLQIYRNLAASLANPSDKKCCLNVEVIDKPIPVRTPHD